MAGLTPTELNVATDAEATRLVYMSLHTGDPSTTGANEATGGSYARQAVTWGSAASGVATATQVTFASVAAGTYTHGGYWTAATGGTFLGGKALGASQTLASAGDVKVTGTLTGTTS